MSDFYDRLAPYYHLIYPDWEARITSQANQLRDIIQAQWGLSLSSVPDASCAPATMQSVRTDYWS
jgi:hypothetical protein